MGDRNIFRDRTLVLRILVPSLETHLRDKMSSIEEEAAEAIANQNKPYHNQHNSKNNNNKNTTSLLSSSQNIPTPSKSSSSSFFKDGQCVDLEGVTIEPSIIPEHFREEFTTNSKDNHPNNELQNSNHNNNNNMNDQITLWRFCCDGASYPARLVNLPCPVELHKTHDHAMYYKSTDVSQMLIVYEDMSALQEAESSVYYRNDDYPSYYHSGLTHPMNRVVDKRFAARLHKAATYPPSDVGEVETLLRDIMECLGREGVAGRKGVKSSLQHLSTTGSTVKIKEEIVDEVVDYEPWMDDQGNSPKGVEFDEHHKLCKLHPEVWLDKEDEGKYEPPPPTPSSLSSSQPSDKKKDGDADATNTTTTTNSSSSSTTKKNKSKKKKSDISNPSTPIISQSQPSSSSSTSNKKKEPKEKKSKKKKNKESRSSSSSHPNDNHSNNNNNNTQTKTEKKGIKSSKAVDLTTATDNNDIPLPDINVTTTGKEEKDEIDLAMQITEDELDFVDLGFDFDL